MYKYSEGERAGILQKFSSKGWVCKTYEGELALYVVAGVAPEVLRITGPRPGGRRQLAPAVGQRVQLHYSEHPGVPTNCFAETRYFVDRINTIGDQPLIPGPGVDMRPAAPAPCRLRRARRARRPCQARQRHRTRPRRPPPPNKALTPGWRAGARPGDHARVPRRAIRQRHMACVAPQCAAGISPLGRSGCDSQTIGISAMNTQPVQKKISFAASM